ncbi:MAG: methyltransferase domain-containing protein [Myxococcota bacterium]
MSGTGHVGASLRTAEDARSRRDPSAVHHLRTTCRACGGGRLRRFLELGDQPLANSFLRDPSEFAGEPRFPLDVYHCDDCFLVQLADVIDPEILFRSYLYVTGTSDTIAAHNRGYAEAVVGGLGLAADDRVIEVASNDGSLLAAFRERGVRTLGVEPARNLAEQARARGLETLDVFFDEDAAEAILASHGPAGAVIGNNVLAHVDEPRGFLAGARRLLAPGGRVIVEVPHLAPLLERCEYDTVYHEHLCYFSVASLARLFEAAGLRIARVDDVSVHGGSVRVWGAPERELPDHAPAVHERIAGEARQGFQSAERYDRFAQEVAAHRRALLGLLEGLRADGRRLVGYGAPAKGNTLLNYCGIDADWMPYVVDKNPLKVGLYTPGTHIPVRPVETLLEDQPDHVLILAWNFAEEIMAQQREYAARGGRFVLPIPTPEVVG